MNIVNLNTVDVQKWVGEPGNVYIGRKTTGCISASIWGNPFRIGDKYSRATVIKMYEDYLAGNDGLRGLVRGLKDKTLGCWCSPKPCHGEVLHRLAGNNPVYGSGR